MGSHAEGDLMDRRCFLGVSTVVIAAGPAMDRCHAHPLTSSGPGYVNPTHAQSAPREQELFVTCSYAGTDIWQPDYIATVNVDPSSKWYSEVVARFHMPVVGDELRRFGWNVCSSSYGKPRERRYLILPGLRSGRIYVVEVKDPVHLKLHKVIDPTAIVQDHQLSTPLTVRCLPFGEVLISMLGGTPACDSAGFLLLDEYLDPKGRWEKAGDGAIGSHGDFWYQARLYPGGLRDKVIFSSGWSAPRLFMPGFMPKWESGFASHVRMWDLAEKSSCGGFSLTDDARGTLPVRFVHDPTKFSGYVGAVLGGSVWHLSAAHRGARQLTKQVIRIDPVEHVGKTVRPMPTDMVISMDDHFLYLSNWLHGDVRQYDISDPATPKLVGQLFIAGQLGKGKSWGSKMLSGGPQMLQLSLDGKRLYVTNSFFSSWDNQFYPDIATSGSWMVQVDCNTEKGGLSLNPAFFVDFGKEPSGPSRAHEMHLVGGDCTSEIFV
ncbi:MAG: selenium-binding family protein [Gemmataceae bacterium]|nr:selenium-binding family protein [Gemmataceae bacterium]